MPKKINKKLPSLTIIIPAYNEEESLKFVVNDILADAPKYLNDFEILIIDDGSSDQTGKIADELSAENSHVYTVHQSNGGYGVAMLRGIKEAKKEFIAYMPADGQYLLRDMNNCLLLIHKADLILGYRGTRADYSLYRLFLSYSYLILLRILFGINYKDVNWLNIWRTKEAQNLKIDSQGIFLLAEIAIRFQMKGLKVIEAPSFYRSRRGGKVKNAKLSIAMQTFIDVWKLWLKKITVKL
jgi:glycosyltransferase involved in cell wall biosynthesis